MRAHRVRIFRSLQTIAACRPQPQQRPCQWTCMLSANSGLISHRAFSSDASAGHDDNKQETQKTNHERRGKLQHVRVDISKMGVMRSMTTDQNEADEELKIELDSEALKLIKEPMTPLAEELANLIDYRGPIPVHDYMQQCLNHPTLGYYQLPREKIGSLGDFVTSPEISQLFGEMVTVWLVDAWMKMGSPAAVDLLELGPGKGTLMVDILRVAKRFPAFYKALHVHMVDRSLYFQQEQQKLLGTVPITTAASPTSAPKTTIKHTHGASNNSAASLAAKSLLSSVDVTHHQTPDGIPISWYFYLQQVPRRRPMLAVGQEFLDVFPVHQFVFTAEHGWREKLVDRDRTKASRHHFRMVVAKSVTPAASVILGHTFSHLVNTATSTNKAHNAKQEGDAKLILPEGVTKSQNTVSDKSNNNGKDVDKHKGKYTGAGKVKVGDEIEISPLALGTCEELALRIRELGGAALLIDYGENFTQGDSIRAFKKHEQVSIFAEPGQVDMTADVDFSACARSATQHGVGVAGPVTQEHFLLSMGIVDRLQHLLEKQELSEEQAEELVKGFNRLVGEEGGEGFGTRFKVMAIAAKGLGVHGFEVVPVEEK